MSPYDLSCWWDVRHKNNLQTKQKFNNFVYKTVDLILLFVEAVTLARWVKNTYILRCYHLCMTNLSAGIQIFISYIWSHMVHFKYEQKLIKIGEIMDLWWRNLYLSGDFYYLLITFANILDQERGPILDPNCLKFMKKVQTTIFKKACKIT